MPDTTLWIGVVGKSVVVLLLFRYHMTITMAGILTMLATAGAPLNDCSYSYACLYNKMLA